MMRKALWLLLLFCAPLAVPQENAFSSACRRAQRENKPVLLLQLFGRLDEEYC